MEISSQANVARAGAPVATVVATVVDITASGLPPPPTLDLVRSPAPRPAEAIETLIKFCMAAREVNSDEDERKILERFMILVQRATVERKEVLEQLRRTCYLTWTGFPARYPNGHSVTPSQLAQV
jgi:hypothetical protein